MTALRSGSMSSPANSQPESAGERNTLLSFFAYIGVILGAYVVLRKYAGVIPALIVAYILYVYRNDVGNDLKELIRNGRA